jgi:Ca2+-binding EF-hand superfamily protein
VSLTDSIRKMAGLPVEAATAALDAGAQQAAHAEAPVSAQAGGARGGAPAGRAAVLASVQGGPSGARDPRLDAYVNALRTQPKGELAKTLEAMKRDDRALYRAGLREVFPDLVGDASRLVLHNMAMDEDHDGRLTFGEAYSTMRDMGFSRTRAFLLSGLTALVLGPQTNEGFSLSVDVANSDKAERSMFRNAFDTKEAMESRLDEIMAYDKDGDGYVTMGDLERMVDQRVSTMDNKLAARALAYLNKGEWQALVSLMDGKMSRDELRDFYTGSLFFSLLEPENLAGKLVAYRANPT